MSDAPALELRDVVRTYRQGGNSIDVLRGVSLALKPGEVVALVGPSGAGKSTLLHAAGLLERPDKGEVLIDGQACGGLGDGERTALRRAHLGFVYQFHHLLPEFSALENVMLPQLIAGKSRAAARKRAHELLALVGLEARATHRPARLSGGEQQRVAIVRALANGPRVMLGDEPTGNLDVHTSEEVFEVMLRLSKSHGTAFVIVTHDPALAARAQRVLELRDGALHRR